MAADLISRARARDGGAFRELTEPYRRSDRWAAPDGPPVRYIHTGCGDGISQQTICVTCGQVHDPAEVQVRPGPGMPADARARMDSRRPDVGF